jgi:hypothetical protein
MQRAEHTARFVVAVAGLHNAEAERLQVADGGGTAMVLPLRGRLRLRDDGCHLQGPLVLVSAAAFAAAPGTGEDSVFHRAADRGAVSRAVGKHLLAALLAEGIEALAAQLLQRVAADQAVGAVAVGGNAVEGEPCPPSASPVRWCSDLGHVFAQDPPGHVLRWGGAGCCLANQWPSSSMSMRGW